MLGTARHGPGFRAPGAGWSNCSPRLQSWGPWVTDESTVTRGKELGLTAISFPSPAGPRSKDEVLCRVEAQGPDQDSPPPPVLPEVLLHLPARPRAH